MKNKFIFGCLMISCQMFGQFIPPPSDYDWKESVEITTSKDVFFDARILGQIPLDAMFWIEIQPEVSTTIESKYVLDNREIYYHSKTISTLINNQPYLHGLLELIITQGKILKSTYDNPLVFEEDMNSATYNLIENETIEISSFLDFSEIMYDLLNNGFVDLLIGENGHHHLRNVDEDLDIILDFDNHLITQINLSTNRVEMFNYSEVQEGIWKIVQKVETTPTLSVEGYCIEERQITHYENYNFDIRSDFPQLRKSNMDRFNNVNVIINGNNLIISGVEGQNRIRVIDVLGHIFLNNIFSGELNFDLKNNGIYFIEIINSDGNRLVKKIIKQ